MKKKLNFYFDFLKKKFLEREINSLAKKYINQNYFRMATISYDGISNYTNIFGFYGGFWSRGGIPGVFLTPGWAFLAGAKLLFRN